jgi:hypothetical protein
VVAPNRPVDHRETAGRIAKALRKAITKSGLTHYAIAKKARSTSTTAKCDPCQIDRFMSGDRSLSLETVDLLVLALEIELTLKT